MVILTQCATRLQAEKGATLIPAISTTVWEQGIATRVALYRDWVWNGNRISGARLATVQKANGKVASLAKEKVYAFEIESVGRLARAVPTASVSRILTIGREDSSRLNTMLSNQ